MSYHNVSNLIDVELAGCQAIVSDRNNFEVVRENITLRISGYIKQHIAEFIEEQICQEANNVTVPFFEYVINELQYEYRVAKTVGYHRMDRERETDIMNKWAAYIIDRAGVDAALDFINALKANREKRTRAFEIIW